MVFRLICGGLWEKVHLLGLLRVYEVVGFPFRLYRRCFPAFSLAKRKGFGQKRSFRWMRRAFEARPHEGIFTTAFAALAKGLAVYEGKSQRTRRYRAGANGVRDAALRRPTEGERYPCLSCSRRGGYPFDLRWAEGKVLCAYY